jgi:hypothetical protein
MPTYLFDEVLFNSNLLTEESAVGSPEYANTMIPNPATGIYKINVNRYDFQHVWNINTKLLTAAQLDYFNEFWAGGFGSAYGFRIRIISDFYMIDEVIGTGDGAKVIFPIIRTYTRPGASHNYQRRIIKPVVVPSPLGSSVALFESDGATNRIIPSTLGAGLGVPAFTVKLNTTPTSAYVVNNTTGVITMNSPPALGVSVKVSCEYDTAVRFMNNSFQQKPGVTSDVGGLQLCEILAAELGIA